MIPFADCSSLLMIVFINGAFGSGKSTVAEGLAARIPNSLIYDPEEVGYMLRNILRPIDWSGDFQDYPMWPTLVPMVGQMLAEQYGRTLIVPMTIWNVERFQRVIDGFSKFDDHVRHFCLCASASVIHQRLLDRGDEPGSWPFLQTERCVSAFESSTFEERIDTGAISAQQVIDRILERVFHA